MSHLVGLLLCFNESLVQFGGGGVWIVMEAWLSPARFSRVDGLWVEGADPSQFSISERLIFQYSCP